MVPDHGRPFRAALGPVTARHVAEWRAREGSAIRARTREDVVLVRFLGTPVDELIFFVQRRLLGDVVAGRVKILDIPGDHDPFRVLPRTVANASRAFTNFGSFNAGACVLRYARHVR